MNGNILKAGDESIGYVDFREFFPLHIRFETHCGQSPRFLMGVDSGANVDVGNDLSVSNYERVVFEKMTGIIKRTSRAENLRFFDRIFDIYANLEPSPSAAFTDSG